MTRTIIFTALRQLILSVAMTSPAQAWPGLACVAPQPTAVALVREAHPHIHNTGNATTPLPPTRRPDREGDPLASMHFE